MESVHEWTITCPYCGEPIDVLIDSEEIGQEYIEDCQVCCRPIVFSIQQGGRGELDVQVRSEDDTG